MPEDDSELMARYVRGDSAAFDTLFDRYRGPLHRYFCAQGASQEIARDLTQLTFMHLHRSRGDFRPGQGLRPWIYAIARNALRQELRRRRRKPEALTPSAALEQARCSETPGGDRLDVARLLERLSPPQRDVLILHWLQGLSFAEVGAALGVREATARVRAHRAQTQLRKLAAGELKAVTGSAGVG